MVAIRLSRMGAKKRPTYRVVVMDKRRARDSRHIEIVGHYNPRPTPIELVLKRERIDHWLGVGAQMSDTVKRLLKYFDENVAPTIEEEAEPEVSQVEAAPVVEPAVEEPPDHRPGAPVPMAEGDEPEDDEALDQEIEEALAEEAASDAGDEAQSREASSVR